jgi:hypothetical protein
MPEITDKEIMEAVDLVREHGSIRAASRASDIPFTTLQRRYQRARSKAWAAKYPEYDLTHPVAPGMTSRGTSVLYDGDGEIKEYWNKTKQAGRFPEEVIQLPDPKTIVKLSTYYDNEGNVAAQWVAEKPEAKAQVEAWRAFAEGLASDLPRIDPVPLKSDFVAEQFCALYPISDHHLGMLAWGEETRDENYDMKISEELLAGAMDFLLDSHPSCGHAIVMFKGDFMHYDSTEAVTPTNQHKLDSDTRYQKMARTAIRIMRYCVERAAEKHAHVHVMVQIGNHDPSSMAIMKESLAAIYEDNPRIHVDTHPGHFLYYKFGRCLVGSHHGHGRAAKPAQLPLIMATDCPVWWGETDFRYFFVGHEHHDDVQEFPGCRVEKLRILAPPDAYSANNGYRSGQDMKGILLHEEYGETARYLVNPKMLTSLSGEVQL